MEVAVIIVNWNSWETLESCLKAVARQTLVPKQVFMVDNASKDGSVDGVREHFPWVEIILSDENLGFAGANNLALQKAETEWTALLNPDAFPEPDWLKNLVTAAQENPDYSFFASHMILHGQNDKIDGTGDCYHVSGLAWRRDHTCSIATTRRSMGETFSACGAAALYKTEALRAVGGFDEDFFCYLEDVDIGFRLRLLGHKCLYVPNAVVEHIGVTSNGHNKLFAISHSHRNMVWLYVKNMPFPLIWFYAPQFLMANLAALVWQSCKGNRRMIFKAKWDAIQGLPKILQKRRSLQRQRQVSLKDISENFTKKWWLPYLRDKKFSKS